MPGRARPGQAKPRSMPYSRHARPGQAQPRSMPYSRPALPYSRRALNLALLMPCLAKPSLVPCLTQAPPCPAVPCLDPRLTHAWPCPAQPCHASFLIRPFLALPAPRVLIVPVTSANDPAFFGHPHSNDSLRLQKQLKLHEIFCASLDSPSPRNA